MNKTASPPRACLTVRVGVTGHRLSGLAAANEALLRTRVREVLEHIRDTAQSILDGPEMQLVYAKDPPVLRIVSAVAEGADCIVAQEALNLGFELQCPLPFHQREYEKDFITPESYAEYHALLEKAVAVLALDGAHESNRHANEAYEAAGRMVLKQSDLLIAIWDGKAPAGQGGTGQIVEEAVLEVPIVWIYSHPPHEACLYRKTGAHGKLNELAAEVKRRYDFSSLADSRVSDEEPHSQPSRLQGFFSPRPLLQVVLLEEYFSESQQRNALAVWFSGLFRRFRNLLAGDHKEDEKYDSQLGLSGGEDSHQTGKNLRDSSACGLRMTRAHNQCGGPLVKDNPGRWQGPLADFAAESRTEWRHAWQASPDFPRRVREHIEAAFLDHYVWADTLADYYANLYRSSFVVIYLAGGAAVFFALLAYTTGWGESGELVSVGLEFLCISFILWLYWFGTQQHWHQRWIDYRLLAEQLRYMRFLAPLGRALASVRVPAYETHGDPRRTWVNWHFRAILREAGMISARIDGAYLQGYRELLAGYELPKQIHYHQDNARRFHRIDHRLHQLGLTLFGLTLLACLLHVLAGLADMQHLIGHHSGIEPLMRILTASAAIFPAVGAAIYGIRSQGEFRRITERSRAMSAELGKISQEVKNLTRGDPLSSVTLGQAAEQAADVMITEVLDWRVVFQARPLALPG